MAGPPTSSQRSRSSVTVRGFEKSITLSPSYFTVRIGRKHSANPDPGGPPLAYFPPTVYLRSFLRQVRQAPVEVGQAMIEKEPPCIGVAAAGHPSVKAAVVVRKQVPGLQVDRAPLFETYVMRDRRSGPPGAPCPKARPDLKSMSNFSPAKLFPGGIVTL